jgi:Glycosyl transferases group 1
MIVYYFGADAPWENHDEADINRRNMAVLLAIAEQSSVTKVFNIIRCTRKLLLNKDLQKKSSHPKIVNMYIGALFPERGILEVIFRPLNKAILKITNPIITNGNKTLSWCYWPKGYNDFKYLGLQNRMIFDTDHNIIDDPSLSAAQKEQREHLLIEAAHSAELILSSSRSMIAWYNKKGFGHTQLMMNGVFKSRINLKNSTVKTTDTLRVTYCGTLSKWVKADWMIKMAKEHPNMTINIIGKNYKTELESQLQSFENIKMHGYLKPKAVDKILQNTDVCIGLYREDDALDVNSMKLYDYLSQGVPVVVNPYHNNIQTDFQDLLSVGATYEEFIGAICHPKEIKNEDILAFLDNSTWYKRVKGIFDNIE